MKSFKGKIKKKAFIKNTNTTLRTKYDRRNLFKIGRYKEGLEVYQKETGVIELDDDNIKIVSE